MNTDQELSLREFVMREDNSFHAPYSPEFAFYIAVKNGEVDQVAKMCESAFSDKNGFGKLSDNILQNLKYHFAITAALIARYCIEGGMEHEAAYSLSDLYIQKADKCSSIAQISKLHAIMSADYAQRMKNIRKMKLCSKQVVKCIDYIYDNLHKRILVSDLADYVKLNPSYLSKLFKQETGATITEYIQSRKIETAQNLLKYTDYQPSYVATILAFPSQSYFIDVFKKRVGMTPRQYQETCFRKIEIHKV
jgi:YesN/AraC family two-component response regulator